MNIEDELVRIRGIIQSAINDLEVAMAQEEVELAGHYVDLAITELKSLRQPNQMLDMLGDYFEEDM